MGRDGAARRIASPDAEMGDVMVERLSSPVPPIAGLFPERAIDGAFPATTIFVSKPTKGRKRL
jgi:hypothetical protein